MTNYREILRLYSLGLNKSQIAQSLDCSRTTVIQVLNIAEEKRISYPLPEDLSDRKLSFQLLSQPFESVLLGHHHETLHATD